MFAKSDEKPGESITTASPIPLPALNVSGTGESLPELLHACFSVVLPAPPYMIHERILGSWAFWRLK